MTAIDPSYATSSAHFRYEGGTLFCEGVRLDDLATEHGTPLYVYSKAAMVERFALLREAFGKDARICYAVKSNSNLSILKLFGELGSGFDLVSGGELQRLQVAGVDTARAVFAGVAKANWEIEAGLDADILLFNLESEHELPILADLAKKVGKEIRVAIRLNVDVDPNTHEYISTGRKQDKFGLDLERAAVVVDAIATTPGVALTGYHVHLGSLLRQAEPYLEALDRVLEFMAGKETRRDGVEFYDCGGGFGVSYGDGDGILDVKALGAAMRERLDTHGLAPILEPGRFLVADAGALVTEVVGVKTPGDYRFVLVDAAMNDLLRPALYGATHPIATVTDPDGAAVSPCNVVGPVCESADFLAKGCPLPEVQRGERLAVLAAGAYGMSMTSNYNSRRRAAEVLVDGEEARLIRRRESFDDLWRHEQV